MLWLLGAREWFVPPPVGYVTLACGMEFSKRVILVLISLLRTVEMLAMEFCLGLQPRIPGDQSTRNPLSLAVGSR